MPAARADPSKTLTGEAGGVEKSKPRSITYASRAKDLGRILDVNLTVWMPDSLAPRMDRRGREARQ